MPVHKVTQFLSEISTFFKKSDSDHAMFAIMDVIKGIRMNEWTLFGRKSRPNSKYSLLQVFQLLLVCPCFMIRNPFNIYGSPLGGKLGCRKDVFYEFLNDGRTDWRKLMYHIASQLWTKVIVRSDHKFTDTCLMIDDTDFPKTGRRMENIGRIHSHLEHRSILGFKALFLGITDGISQTLLDFAILGEKGRKGNYGMSEKELSRRMSACSSSVAANEVHGADCSRQTSRWDSSRHTGFTPDAGPRRSSSRRARDCSAFASASLPTLLRR